MAGVACAVAAAGGCAPTVTAGKGREAWVGVETVVGGTVVLVAVVVATAGAVTGGAATVGVATFGVATEDAATAGAETEGAVTGAVTADVAGVTAAVIVAGVEGGELVAGVEPDAGDDAARLLVEPVLALTGSEDCTYADSVSDVAAASLRAAAAALALTEEALVEVATLPEPA